MDFDKDFHKEIGKAIVLGIVSATITHLVAWGFEKIRDRMDKDK
jgi:hypothetical protein